MSIVDIAIDTAPLTKYLDDFEQRQVPYALSNTLNDVGLLFQYRQREHDSQIFTVRRRDFVDKSVKITHFAKKSELYTTVAIQSPGNGDRSDILAKFEDQTTKTPTSGQAIAVPVDVKRNKADIIPQANRPRAFNFRQIGGSALAKSTRGMTPRLAKGVLRGALQVWEGDKRTFMIRNAQGQGVILQRTGRGRKHEGLKLLYYLTPRVKIKPDLHFQINAEQAATHAPDYFRARFNEAMATAK